MDISLLIRLVDQFSAPAKRVGDALNNIGDRAGELAQEFRSGFGQAIRQGLTAENYEAAIAKADAAVSKARRGFVAAAGIAAPLIAALKPLGSFEERLVDFGNVASIFGDDLAGIETELRALGPQVNKTAGELLTALEYLVGKGLSPEEGMAALRAVGMTATATKSEVEDMAASGFAVLDNLRVPAEQLQQAFDAMAQAGKSGGFELKGMAQYFPSLTASARALGMEGVDAVAELAAALQIAMKGAGDESTAANNMQNFLSKLSSPETVKRFKDLGVDIRKEFEIAEANGVSVFEHMLQRIHEITGGDQFKMGELFGDQQVLSFLRPLMANLEEFREIRDAALSADGVNAGDFARVMDGFNARMKALRVEFDNLLSAGSPLLDMAKDLAASVSSVVRRINEFVAANPGLTRQLVTGAAGLIAFNVAARTVGLGLAVLRRGIIEPFMYFLKFDAAGRNIATGWQRLAGVGRFLAGAFGIVKAAALGIGAAIAGISAPVWAAAAAVAAAGFAVWKYWDRISSFVSGFAGVFGDLLGPAVNSAIGWIDSLTGRLAELLGFDSGQVVAFKAALGEMFDFSGLIDGARSTLASFSSWLGGFFSQETLSEGQKAGMHEAGRNLANNLIDGMLGALAAGWARIEEWLAGKIGWLRDKALSIGSYLGLGETETGPTIEVERRSVAIRNSAAAQNHGGGAVSGFLSGMNDAAFGAATDLERGGNKAGDAVAEGGIEAGRALQRGADAITRAVGSLANAISRAGNISGGASLAGSLDRAASGALHDGVD